MKTFHHLPVGHRSGGRPTPVAVTALALTLALLGVVATLVAPPRAEAVGEPTFTNSLVRQADPTIEYYAGNYYMSATTWGGSVTMRKSPTLGGLKTAQEVTVYSDTTPGQNANMWAPELQRLQGPNGWRWYLMYTMGTAGDYGKQHMHVLESLGDDPMGPYVYKARPIPTDAWNIDGAYLQLNGSLYVVWSMFAPDGLQSDYIAKMTNPWTITGTPAILSQPTQDWEKEGGPVNEGPVPLQRNGTTWITYSASNCQTQYYKLGTLKLTGTDPLVASSWTKSAGPVFQSANGVYGPGHNDFFTSPDGTQTWNFYHGNDSANDRCSTTRSSRAQPLTWTSAGEPDFGQPVATGTALPVPSGERGPTTTDVRGAAWQLVNRNSGLCAAVPSGATGNGTPLQQVACSSSGSTWKLDSTADGYYRLVNPATGKVLDSAECGTANGMAAREWAWLANSCQQWRPAPSSGGWSTLTNRANDLVLDAAECRTTAGSAVRQWAALGNACQDWALRPAGQVGLQSLASGKSLDLAGCSTAAGTALRQYTWVAGSTCQRWTVTAATDGWSEVHATSAPTLCLGVAGSTADNGAAVTQQACGSTATRWRLDPVADGGTRFVAAVSGKVLDLSDCSNDAGAAFGQWADLSNQCQRFRVVG